MKLVHYCYLTKIIHNDKIRLYFGKHSSRCGLDNNYIGSGKFIKSARKNPEVKFEKTVLCVFDTKELNAEFENLLVSEAKEKFENCVNIAEGGIGGKTWGNNPHPMQGRRMPASEDRKAKISATMKDKFSNQIHWAKDVDRPSRRSSRIPWEHYDALYNLWVNNNFPKRGSFNKLAKTHGYPAVDYAGMVINFMRKRDET
ncbi:hypothetical protein [Salmonella phage GRNsp7]|jgi:hypothetical protein|nr:hypothetical protein [Salmonella phage GRNsp7]